MWIDIAISSLPLVLMYIFRPMIPNKYMTLTDSTWPRLEEDYNVFADFLEKLRDRLKQRRLARGDVYDPEMYHEDLAEVGLKPTTFNIDEFDESKISIDPELYRIIANGEVFFLNDDRMENLVVKSIKRDKIIAEINGKTTILTDGRPVYILDGYYVPEICREADDDGIIRPAVAFHHADEDEVPGELLRQQP